MSHWDFRLEIGLCKLVLAAYETEHFVVAEASKSYNLEAMKINVTRVWKASIKKRYHWYLSLRILHCSLHPKICSFAVHFFHQNMLNGIPSTKCFSSIFWPASELSSCCQKQANSKQGSLNSMWSQIYIYIFKVIHVLECFWLKNVINCQKESDFLAIKYF